MQQKYYFTRILLLFAIGLASAPVITVSAQGGYNISVNTSPNPSEIGQQVTISVTVTDGGNPVSGISVDISVDGAGIGSCTTNSNGSCSVGRSFGDSGSYWISASAGGASGGTTHTVNAPPTDTPPPTNTPTFTPVPPTYTTVPNTNTPKPANTTVAPTATRTRTPAVTRTSSITPSITITATRTMIGGSGPTATKDKTRTVTVTTTKTTTVTNTITPTPTSYLLPSLTPRPSLLPSLTPTRLPTRAPSQTPLPAGTSDEPPLPISTFAFIFLFIGGGGLIWLIVSTIQRRRL